MRERRLNLGAWARRKQLDEIASALQDAPPHVVAATIAAAKGAHVQMTEAFRQLIVLRAVRGGLAKVRASARPMRDLEVLLWACGADEQAFDCLELQPRDIAFVSNPRRGAVSVTAYLLLRAGACGVPRKREPAQKDVERVVRALWQAEHRAKTKR